MTGELLDLLVLGSGVAGLSAAVRAAEIHGLRVGLLTKGDLDQAATRWAQGGVAAVLHEDPDSTDLHLADTLAAGAGLCDTDAVRVLVDEGPGRVNELIALGAAFDRDSDGRLELAREGGHSLPRIVHAGGLATGAEIERALVDAVRTTAAAVHERWFALELLVDDHGCSGVRAVSPSGEIREVRAGNVLLATGGAGQLFSVTTSPDEVTGDGTAMCLRAGVACADLEFVQFHPTALHRAQTPRPLLSEALRGHGALLRDRDGDRFVDELLPRDEVSRAMTARMREQQVSHLWLDATGLENFATRFPTLANELAAIGLDPTSEWLPIAPAAHYSCGGVVTDLRGATELPGLWAAGEVACTGVHGANRLASNSLLEGMVFGPRVVEAIARGERGTDGSGAMRSVIPGDDGEIPAGIELAGDSLRSLRYISAGGPATRPDQLPDLRPGQLEVSGHRATIQATMTRDAGVLRDADGLAMASEVFEGLANDLAQAPASGDYMKMVEYCEVRNLLTVGIATVAAAMARTESRGSHTRVDHPEKWDSARRIVARSPEPVIPG